MPHDEIDDLFNHFQKLNASHRKDFIDYLQKVFDDSAWSKPRAGVPEGTANANQKRLHKEEQNELEEIIDEEFGLSPEFQEKAIKLFEQRVEERVANDPFRKKLAALLEAYATKLGMAPSPFISSKKLDVCELLATNMKSLKPFSKWLRTRSNNFWLILLSKSN